MLLLLLVLQLQQLPSQVYAHNSCISSDTLSLPYPLPHFRAAHFPIRFALDEHCAELSACEPALAQGALKKVLIC